MLESKIYAEFSRKVGRTFNVERIENAISSGMFDCVLSLGGRTLWLEFKKDEDQKLRGTQVGWVLRRYKFHCQSDMLVVTMLNGIFIVASAVDMAKRDLKISEAMRVAVTPKAITEFMLTVAAYGDSNDEPDGHRQGIGPYHGSNTKH